MTKEEGVLVNSTDSELKNSFAVSFISIGTGIDLNAKNTFNQFITSFEKANDVKLMYEIINWGREGETDYCFDFKPLELSIQEKFIAKSKDALRSSTLIRYLENKVCREVRN